MDMTNKIDAYGYALPADTEELLCFADGHKYLFEDMLFEKNSLSGQFIKAEAMEDGKWHEIADESAVELESFNYGWFDYHIADLDNDIYGFFNPEEQSMTIDTAHADDEATILHEMIHLHEYVLNALPMFYHDSYFWCLYTDLRDKIPDLDERIRDYGHITKEKKLAKMGGVHDLTFLLKSFDIDLCMGYKLGTVFGYGYDDGQKGLDI